jgi:hypothetical protein
MILFALCLNPLLQYLDDRLQGLRSHGRQNKTTGVAYADEISILVTSPKDVRTIIEAITCYEKATGTVLNVAKSRGLEVGSWNTSYDIMGIPYCEEIMILGVKLRNTIKTSALASWTRLTPLTRTQPQQAYSRDLNLAQRITYVQVYMLAKLWKTAQMLQPPRECLRQILSTISCYIWQGAIFRVPLSTL